MAVRCVLVFIFLAFNAFAELYDPNDLRLEVVDGFGYDNYIKLYEKDIYIKRLSAAGVNEFGNYGCALQVQVSYKNQLQHSIDVSRKEGVFFEVFEATNYSTGDGKPLFSNFTNFGTSDLQLFPDPKETREELEELVEGLSSAAKLRQPIAVEAKTQIGNALRRGHRCLKIMSEKDSEKYSEPLKKLIGALQLIEKKGIFR